MAINFPTSLDSLTNPSGTQNMGTPDHSVQHSNINDIGEQLEIKVGVGAGSPVLNQALIGSGNGTSGWTGTWNNATLGTPSITGGTVNNSVIGTPSITGGTITSSSIGTVIGARVYNNANIATGNGTALNLTFNSVLWDTNNIHGTTNPGRLTCQTAGKYNIGCILTYDANAVGRRITTIFLNNGTAIAGQRIQPTATETSTFHSVNTIWDLAVNDYLEVQVYQSSGTTLNIVYESGTATSPSPQFWMVRMGA